MAASEEWTAEGQPTPAPRPEEAPVPDMPEAVASAAAETDETPVPCPPIRSHAARMLSRLALGLLVAVVVINIPLTRHGLTLATAMPDSRSMVIRDRLVVVDTRAFEAEGHVWEDVGDVPCQRLRDLPDGDTIPPGQGSAPQP